MRSATPLGIGNITFRHQKVDSMKAVLAEGYDAVLVGSGAPRGRDLDVPGRKEAAANIHIGLDWLSSVLPGHITKIAQARHRARRPACPCVRDRVAGLIRASDGEHHRGHAGTRGHDHLTLSPELRNAGYNQTSIQCHARAGTPRPCPRDTIGDRARE